MDRRTERARARHAAYSEAARVLRREGMAPPERAWAAGCVDVYLREVRRLLRWLDARGRGRLAIPPGGTKRAA